jgi:protocatechuate 3,4-dioxygenase beta subunit
MNDDILDSRRRVSRRRALGLGGSIGLGGLLAACGTGEGRNGAPATPTASAPTTAASVAASASTTAGAGVVALLNKAGTCMPAQEETQGPYWFDVDSIRSDLREDRPGMPLTLAVRVHDLSGCSAGAAPTAIRSAVVEIWHCDAGGVYSGFESASTGGGRGAPGGPPGSSGDTSNGSYSTGDSEASPTDDGTYLRGAQVTDPGGIVQFATIYPGWYRGRTVHIHLKVHLDKKTVLTTQLYMDEAVNDAVFATAPYREHTGRDTTNDNDDIFDTSGLLTLQRQGSGYLGVVNLGIA